MVLTVILPICLLLLLGFVCVKFKFILPEHIQGLSQFVFKISLPAFLFLALASRRFDEIWNSSYFIGYAGGSLLVFAVAFALYHQYFRCRLSESAVLSMGASMSNTGFIGTAILTLLIGQQAAVYLSLTLIIENLLIVAFTLILAEAGIHQHQSTAAVVQQTLKNVAKSPIILSIVFGMLCVLFKLQLPLSLIQVLAMLGKTASPVALFVIGGSLVGMSLKAIDLQSIILVLLKLVLMPLTIFILLSVLPDVTQEMRYAGTLLAALPMPIIFGIFGQNYGLSDKALSALMLSTLLGFMLISGLIAVWW